MKGSPMSNPVSFRFIPDGEGKTLTVQMEQAGEALCHATIEAPELEAVIAALIVHRSNMAEKVPETLESAVALRGTHNPAWMGKVDSEGNRVLIVRDPGMGWHSVGFSPVEAKKVGAFLSAY